MLVSVIRDRAFRMLLGRKDTPPSDEATEALEAFQSLINGLPGTLGMAWTDVVTSTDYTAGEDERITISSGSPTITRPTLVYIEDGSGVATGATYDETTMRPPRDGARIQVVTQSSGASVLYFWRADRAGWMSCASLAASDECPLGGGMDRFLPAMLAVELQAEYGQELSPLVLDLNAKGWNKLRARYGARRKVAVEEALLTMSTQTNDLTEFVA